jgi:hypothetical protein
MITLRLIAIGLTGVSAFMLTGRQDSNSSKNAYEDVCLPTNAAGLPDFSAPCNLRSRTERLCVFGEQIRGIVDSSGLDNYGEKDGHPMSHQLYRNQRDCICQSQLFDQMEGCRACFYAVVGDARYLYASSAIKSFSSTYCAVTAMPQAYYVAMDSVLEALDEKTDPPTSVSSPPNPFGSKTDVSFYWTPSATGVSAWDVRLPTRATATFSSLHTSEGQIIPTAGVEGFDIEDNDPKSASTVSEGKAVETGKIEPHMVAGFMGAVAMAVVL